MVMTIFLGAGYLNWRADNLVFGHFKGHNSEVPGVFGWL